MVEQNGAVSIKNVSKIYPNGTIGLNQVDLDIKAGEFVVIVGLSGAGKSTLLRAINRLHDVTSGTIVIDGQDITQAKGRQLRNIRRNIAMIFQNFNLVKRATVGRNVLNGRVGYYATWQSILGLFSAADKQQAIVALEHVNMLEKYYIRADELSGGQQQRVAIARAMVQSPHVVLADEPIAALDPKNTQMVMDDLKRLNEELGLTVIVNLHSVPLALQYASRIVGLRAGQLVYDKPIDEVNQNDFDAIYVEESAKESSK
ncbi:phosphonate ABC transporter ATP-binding protein [Weissella diestrammenae]|uniref:Phosphonate ABC transporter ATP-binding protein n=1 Tax=Weissella diestrammenae TaxID=1162633 RepID=A0A7G9T702_9LACO|nr:phosphonate ABC transporter ATP-binding protein [Weissella diestrammenae]MCM0582526.1 phosphonate ABC transporter ATP-binding protein [Weissella diestrammenae]QNN75877.1 phosphonate ABC transporter ATP-binding protein [Weissella diestrammenae]